MQYISVLRSMIWYVILMDILSILYDDFRFYIWAMIYLSYLNGSFSFTYLSCCASCQRFEQLSEFLLL